MAENILKTRVKLLYKTYEQWEQIKSTFIPMQGEVCFVEIPAATGSLQQEPALIWKVGNGVDTFEDLPYGSALAADVYDWAKKNSLKWEDLDSAFLENLDDYIEANSDTDTQYKLVKDGADTYHIELRKLKDGVWSAWSTDPDSATISLAHKVDKQIIGSNGKALIFNESDGGGAKFEHNDGTNSFVGVNDGGANGLSAQIYSVDKTTNKGTRINVTSNGIFYTNGRTSYADTTAADEIATKGDLNAGIESLDVAALAVNPDETISSISETDGLISVSKQNIQIAESQVTGLIADLASKTPHTLNGANGVARMFNETDGGGAKFEHTDGTWSFVGVNDGGANGLAGQIYAVDKDTKLGTRINVTKTGIYYTKGKTSYSQMDADDEIATLANIKSLGDALHYIGMTTKGAEETEDAALARVVAHYQESHPSYVLSGGAVAILTETTEAGTFNREFIYADGDGWQSFGDEGIYETKAEANAAHQSLLDALAAEEAARIAADNTKVTIDLNGPNGQAKMFNESDGGGAMFTHNDGTKSFVGVNDGGNGGLAGQIYAINKDTKVGSRINITDNGIFYTNGNANAAYVPGDEIATKNDITELATTIASESILGVVLSSNAANVNMVNVDQTTGVMEVNQIGVKKLVNDGDLLVLDCNNNLY